MRVIKVADAKKINDLDADDVKKMQSSSCSVWVYHLPRFPSSRQHKLYRLDDGQSESCKWSGTVEKFLRHSRLDNFYVTSSQGRLGTRIGDVFIRMTLILFGASTSQLYLSNTTYNTNSIVINSPETYWYEAVATWMNFQFVFMFTLICGNSHCMQFCQLDSLGGLARTLMPESQTRVSRSRPWEDSHQGAPQGWCCSCLHFFMPHYGIRKNYRLHFCCVQSESGIRFGDFASSLIFPSLELRDDTKVDNVDCLHLIIFTMCVVQIHFLLVSQVQNLFSPLTWRTIRLVTY